MSWVLLLSHLKDTFLRYSVIRGGGACAHKQKRVRPNDWLSLFLLFVTCGLLNCSKRHQATPTTVWYTGTSCGIFHSILLVVSFFVLCVQTLVLCEPCCFLYCHCFAAKYSFCVRLKHEKTNNRCGRLGVHMAQEQICFLCRGVFLYYLAYSTLSQHSAKSARASVLWWDGLSYWFIGMPQNLMQPESDATVYYGSSNLQSACGHSQNALTLGSRSLCIQSLS